MRNKSKKDGNQPGSSTVPEVVAGLFYRYGLLVASHPSKFIFIAVATIISLGTPLIYLPLPVYVPQEYTTILKNYSIPAASSGLGLQLNFNSDVLPAWYQGLPRAYIQQIIVRSTVSPWREGITVGESIRGPLFTVFHVSQLVSDFQMKDDASVALFSECLLVEEVVRKMKSSVASLPNYNCLMLSPADIWGRDPQSFIADKNVLFTVNSLKGKYDGMAGIANILFGLPYKDVGIHASTSHPQIINYAVTLVLRRYSKEFIDNLEEELMNRFPLNQPLLPVRQYITHMYFPSHLSVWEFMIATFYCFLFSSIYFSVLKMKGLYSKLGLAVSVIVTLISSLGIAVSITAHLGLRPLYTQCNFIHVFIAGLIGFENSIALIRSILSNPDHLDIKIRVAQGLAREGWTITKYWLTMITIVTLSFFLFIPFVQEFCIYGSLVLLCDLYMQMVFLTAVISTDIKRFQQADESQINLQPKYLTPYSPRPFNQTAEDGTHVPNLHRRYKNATQGEDRLATPQTKPQSAEKMPKRLRLTYFMARKRMFQRILMCIFVSWIAYVISSAEFVDQLTDRLNGNFRTKDLCAAISALTNRSCNLNQTQPPVAQLNKEEHSVEPKMSFPSNETKDNTVPAHGNMELLKHKHRATAKRLPQTHWPALFSYYNISLRGKYLTILPPIMLSTAVSPDDARKATNMFDPHINPWKPQFTKDSKSVSEEDQWSIESAIIPSSRGELIVTGFLVIPAVAFLVYALITFYRVICTRNYAEWRSSWKSDESVKLESSSQIVGEAVPLMMAGHPHDVECLCTDGSLVVSACLAGAIYVWDPVTGECICTIDRHKMQSASSPTETVEHQAALVYQHESPDIGICSCSIDRDQMKLSSYSSPSLSDIPDLTPTINLEFNRCPPMVIGSPFDGVKQIYEDFNKKQQRQRKSVSCYECHYDKFNDYFQDEGSYPSSYSYKPKSKHMRNLSAGNIPNGIINRMDGTSNQILWRKNGLVRQDSLFPSCPVWCLDCQDGLLFVGTGSSAIEVWDGLTGRLECVFDDGTSVGVTSLKVSGNRVVAARINGSVDVLQLEAHGASEGSWTLHPDDSLRLIRMGLVKAHQQPITVLCCSASRIITGSHDHTLKILNICNGTILFTLHGHYGPVTTIALGGPSYENGTNGSIVVDLVEVSSVVASGSRDGSLCVWDIQSGTCVYSVQAHDGGVSALVCTSSYILSLGEDDKLCVWERFQGHLLNTLVMSHMYSSSMVMLSNRLLITSRQGSLTVWDITVGVPIRVVRLGDHDNSVFVRHLLPVGGSVVCDYGNQLRVVRFPVAEKLE